MSIIREYLGLVSIEYLPVGITGFLVGFFAVLPKVFGINLIFGLISFSLIIFGYNSYNAIIDKEIDKINKPNRPLPRGSITEKEAMKFALVCYLLSLLISYLINESFFLISLFAVALTVAYSHPLIHLKKKFILGTICATMLYTVFAVLLGASIVDGSPTFLFPLIFYLFFLGIPKAILKDYIDVPGDTFHRINSLPVSLGHRSSKLIVGLFYLLSLIILLFLVYQNELRMEFFSLIVFYPFIFFNLKNLHSKYAKFDSTDSVFTNSMIILIAVEITICGILIFLR